ncbi:MAG: redoxin domain-containing protein [Candidatus Kerfeldbacteria bacterium]|nr:redoxin domain-containing protein [Candidatus Kerfeldbacteria bacterium]
MHRNSNGGTIAVIMTIIVVGGLVYLGVSKGGSTAPIPSDTTSSDGHHGVTSGPYADLQSMVGKPAPDFLLTDHNGSKYSLASLKGKNVVLFFNEGMMCYPACWNQIAVLGSDERFSADGVVTLSVVVDSRSEWDKAVSQMPELARAIVVHDTNGAVSSKYGMLTTKSSMHYGQLPGHSYVVIDKQGIIRHVYDDANMAIHNDQLVGELAKL